MSFKISAADTKIITPLKAGGTTKYRKRGLYMFVFHDSPFFETPCEPGVTRKVMAYNDDVMMCEIHFETGAKGNPHNHPHVQCTYVLKGRFSFTIADETKEVSAGDTLLMPSGVLHCCECLEEGMLCDVFTPMRKDFIEKKPE